MRCFSSAPHPSQGTPSTIGLHIMMGIRGGRACVQRRQRRIGVACSWDRSRINVGSDSPLPLATTGNLCKSRLCPNRVDPVTINITRFITAVFCRCPSHALQAGHSRRNICLENHGDGRSCRVFSSMCRVFAYSDRNRAHGEISMKPDFNILSSRVRRPLGSAPPVSATV